MYRQCSACSFTTLRPTRITITTAPRIAPVRNDRISMFIPSPEGMDSLQGTSVSSQSLCREPQSTFPWPSPDRSGRSSREACHSRQMGTASRYRSLRPLRRRPARHRPPATQGGVGRPQQLMHPLPLQAIQLPDGGQGPAPISEPPHCPLPLKSHPC